MSGGATNGQPIDIYDAFGLQAPANRPEQDFEAGFDADGAVCVRHVRVKENSTLDVIAAQDPRLTRHIGDARAEAYARSVGAFLFVRSPP